MPVRTAGHRTASSHRHTVWANSCGQSTRHRSQRVKSTRTVTFPGAAGFWNTVAPLRRGPRDPCFQLAGDGTIWRTSLLPSGPVTARISSHRSRRRPLRGVGRAVPRSSSRCCPRCWAPTTTRRISCRADPTVAAAHRRLPHLRLGRTGQVLEALIPAVIEQRVPGADAFRSWRVLVSKYGTPAPGPAPAAMRVPPAAEVWRHIPSWEFHRANVDPKRAQTVVACARRAASLERLVSRPAAQAREALTSLPGVGEWTAAETAQRALR